jgi:UDP-N-acetylmuramoylalanine--D-glutamate ligase
LANWTNENVLVLGLGRSGISAAEYLAKRKARVLLSESTEVNETKAEQASKLRAQGIEVEFGGHSDRAKNFSRLVVVSPGIAPGSEIIQQLAEMGKDVICDVELAFRDTKIPLVGITGTNGKSTTTALVSHVLSTAGFKAPACGNIGVPVLAELEKQPDFLVTEISSYQLHYCSTLAPKVAVWTNLTPDHIEWHGNLQSYTEAKQKLFANQESNQYAVLNADDPIVSQFSPNSEIFQFSVNTTLDSSVQCAFMQYGFLVYRTCGRTQILCHKEDLKIFGNHNLENALAAVSVSAVLNVPVEKIIEALKTFPGLEHRLEFVTAINGIKYYNDSKGTNTDSTIKALEAFGSQKVVLIAGGKDKHTPLDELVHCIAGHTSDVILLGEAKERFRRALSDSGYKNIQIVQSMEEAVEVASGLGKGPVVLSPACASFDMFKDFEDRGRVFKNLVHARAERMATPR